MALVVKNLPTNTRDIRGVGLTPESEDPLEEGMALTPVSLPGESHGQRSLAVHRAVKIRTRLKQLCNVHA